MNLLSEPKVPDGGVVAWLQVAGSFLLFFNSWGIINAYGVFQTHDDTVTLVHNTPDEIAWIGSVQSFLLLIVGVVAGPLYDMGFFRLLIICGTGFITLGFMFTSLAVQYWQILLSQAFCIGIGTGLIFIPSLALIPKYFSSKRAIATGIVTSGSSLGGVVYPLIFQRLLPTIGFAWTVRTIGFVALGTCGLALVLMRPRGEVVKRRSLVDMKAFRERPYQLYCAAMFFSYVGFFGPVFYLQPFALSHGLSDGTLALYLVAILNASSIPGRILPSYLAGRIGPVNAMLAAAFLCTIVLFCWIAVTSAAGNVVFAVFYGFASGGIISMPAVVLASLTTDMSLFGTRLGMASVLNAFGSLCGTPIAGAILESTNSYLGVQLFCGLAIVATTLLLFALRLSVSRMHLFAKA
ncbi:hypothetical protein G7046_g2527 [Stylonectria norvegica]|nr:hypothetical protein G7046_g2527 [Stylonectria norvegica]